MRKQIFKTDSDDSFTCLIIYAFRLILMDPSTTVTLLSDAHCLAQSFAQPLHPRHEDYWSVIYPDDVALMYENCDYNAKLYITLHFISKQKK